MRAMGIEEHHKSSTENMFNTGYRVENSSAACDYQKSFGNDNEVDNDNTLDLPIEKEKKVT